MIFETHPPPLITSGVAVSVCLVAGGPARVDAPSVCYADLGCFSAQAPFNNTEGLLPQSPQDIATIFR